MVNYRNFISFVCVCLLLTGSASATELVNAAINEDIEKVEYLIQQGVDLNLLDEEEGVAALHAAVFNNDLRLTKLLLENGAKINLKTTNQFDPIHIGAQGGALEVLQYLMTLGVDINMPDGDGDTVLQHALYREQIELANWLLDQGVTVVSKGNENSYGSPLFLAMQLFDNEADNKELLTLIEKIVSLSADLNAFEGGDNQTYLQLAVQTGNLDLVKLLVMLGADVNLKAAEQSAPIHLAAEESSEVFQYLIQAGADINTLDVNGANLLQIALLHGEIEAASWLLDKGIDINSRGLIDTESENDGWNEVPAYDYPVLLLLEQITTTDDDQAAVSLLHKMVRKGANLDVVGRDGSAFIFPLLKSSNQSFINELLPNIKSVDVTDSFGNSVLHAAIKSGHIDYAASLARNGNGLAQIDKIGYTSLHSAYEKELFDIVSLILEHEGSNQMLSLKGASIYQRAYRDGHHEALNQWLANTPSSLDVVDINGDTLLHEAVSRNDVTYVNQLLTRGAKVAALNGDGRSPLSLAVEKNSTELLKLLLDVATKNSTFKKSSMLLHEAARLGSLKIVTTLVEAGFSVDSRDNNGYIPAQIAVHHGQQEVLDYLVGLINAPTLNSNLEVNPYADSRLEYWSLLYWANKKEKLIRSVEQDLHSDNSSVFAPYIWVEIQSNNGNLQNAYNALNGALKSKIAVTADVGLNKDYRQLVAQYPPSYPFVASDAMALIDLAFVADKLVNKPLKLDYLETASRLLPNYWQIAWMYNDSQLVTNTKFKDRMQNFSVSEGINGTLVGNSIREYSHARLWERADLGERSRSWLKTSPHDWRALAANSSELNKGYHYEQAQVAAQKAATIFPFYFDFTQLPTLFIKQGAIKQAEKHFSLIARMYHKEGGEPIEAKMNRYLAASLRTSGDKGRARQVLDDTLQQMPNIANLHREIARLEIADNRYAEAADAMEKVFQLDDETNSSDYKRYISALKQSGDSAQAISVAEKGLAKLTFIPEDFFIAVLDLAAAMKRDALVDRVYQLAVGEFPDSIALGKFHVERLWINDKHAALKYVEKLLEQQPTSYSLIQLWKKYAKGLN
ncbi:ankyrin repeat domain-containing protein, partial [Amphritea sp.]|uniref:ankyrin repeat domain-containing protein n=1 Tax=Amphritea sp. TaxID=1872502 RepID=UPI0025BA1D21